MKYRDVLGKAKKYLPGWVSIPIRTDTLRTLQQRRAVLSRRWRVRKIAWDDVLRDVLHKAQALRDPRR